MAQAKRFDRRKFIGSALHAGALCALHASPSLARTAGWKPALPGKGKRFN